MIATPPSSSFGRPPGQPEPDWNAQAEERNLNRIGEWIRAVDTKASTILTIDTSMIAVIVAFASTAAAQGSDLPLWLTVGCALPALSLILAAFAIVPQTRSPKDSLLFFATIAARPSEQYAKLVSARTPTEYFQDLTAQCHANARIAWLKMRFLGYSMILFFVGITPWMIALYFLIRG